MAGMEGRRPYRIYDPGGGTEENGSAAFERLVEENARLKEKMQGIKSIGNCWGMNFAFRRKFPACTHRAWGFLALLRKGAIRTWGSWHWGSSKAVPILGAEQDVQALSHRGSEGARLLLNPWGALRWDEWLKKRKVVEQGRLPGVLQWQVADARICPAFDESPYLHNPCRIRGFSWVLLKDPRRWVLPAMAGRYQQ